MSEFVIEAQKIAPANRHSFIMQTFESLGADDSLVIVNNHDPVPLLKQFQEKYTDQFGKEYLEQGPDVWRVKITKTKKEGCCGFCGG